MKKFKHSDETKNKIRLAHLGKPSGMLGKKHSKKTKQKMALIKLGKKVPLSIRLKISLSHKGKTLSEETKRKMREAWKKKIVYPNGWKLSKETCKKMSESRIGEKNIHWKGKNVGYGALHSWIRRTLGKPNVCEYCGRSNLSGKFIHWANKSHQYKRDLEDWLRLCAKCHKAYDLENANF